MEEYCIFSFPGAPPAVQKHQQQCSECRPEDINCDNSVGAKGHRTKSSAAIPSNSLNVRLATLERSMSAANKMTSGARRTTSNAAVPLTSSSYGGTGGPPSSSSNGADLADRVAVLEAQLSQFKQSESPGVTSVKSLGLRSNPSLANSAQLAQSDSALREQLSQLQQQFEALMSGKANKADVEALQLHAAMVSGGSSLTSTGGSRGKSISTSSSGGGSGSNGIDSSGGVNIADAGKGAAGTGNGASDAGTTRQAYNRSVTRMNARHTLCKSVLVTGLVSLTELIL